MRTKKAKIAETRGPGVDGIGMTAVNLTTQTTREMAIYATGQAALREAIRHHKVMEEQAAYQSKVLFELLTRMTSVQGTI